MSTPTLISEKRRRAAALEARLPCSLKIPDLRPARPARPQPAIARPPIAQPASSHPPAATTPPVETPPLTSRRYDAGHRQVTQMIDQMRDKRRRLLARLWNVSLALTALSLIALISELVQSWNSSAGDTDAQEVAVDAAPTPSAPKPTAPRRAPRIVPVRAQVLANELPAADDEEPVQQAFFTTRETERPKGVWLDGTIHTDDSDTTQP